MIEASRLTYTYPDGAQPVLRNLDLRVEAGELLLVAGRSGSGKSTLLRAVNGLVPHFYGGRFGGRVVVRGLDTRRATPLELAGQVGFVFQEPEVRFLTGNVADEIAFGLEVAGLPAPLIRERVAQIVERLELTALVDRPLDRLSGGEQQRVAVAAAMARQPTVLVMDEPTSQLDAQSAEEALAWTMELRRQLGLTVLLSEHRLGRLIPGAARVLYLTHDDEARCGPATAVLELMPYLPPLMEAAGAVGLPPAAGLQAGDDLRQRVLAAGCDRSPSRPAPGPIRLAAYDLRFHYDGLLALDGVSIEVRAGEVLALAGRNGSGKTTLLRCLLGLLTPEQGEVRLNGRRVNEWPVSRRARHVGYVPQWPSGLLFADNVRQELWLTLRSHGLESSPPVEPEALLEALGLQAVADRYPRDLSSGERQRAAIAAVLVARPDVVLLDEPTLGIDPLAQRDLGALIASWRRAGMGVVLATHDVEFAASHADTALILEAGRVAGCGPAAETLFSRPALRTTLQRLTGQARPATVRELAQAG
ncbi:MAG: ATP-binding cassette domain-containing protein [Chloroflexota bacterium]